MDQKRQKSAVDVIKEERPRLAAVLDFYAITPEEAGEMLAGLAVALVYRLPQRAEPGRWLGLRTQAECLKLWEREKLTTARPRLLVAPALPEFARHLLASAEDRFEAVVLLVRAARARSERAGHLVFLAAGLGLSWEEIALETGRPVQDVRRSLCRTCWDVLSPALGEHVFSAADNGGL